MTTLFLLFAVAMMLAWSGQRRASTIVFAVTMVLCVLWFSHHITDPVVIDL